MKRFEWLLLGAILAAGLALRLYQLDRVPPGMTHDEADVGHHAAAVYETGQRHVVDQPYGFIHQPFVQYSGALFMSIFGPTDLALRLHSAFFGTGLILLTYFWARRAFDTSIALAAASFMAVGFWPLMTSRFALNNQPVPTIFGLGVVLLWPTLPLPGNMQKGVGWGIAAGFFLGLSVYPYEAGRAVLVSIPVFGLYLLLMNRFSRPHAPLRSFKPFAVAIAVALLIAAPHVLDPRSWGRTGTLVSETVGAGGVGALLSTISEGLGTLFVRGDPFVTYNVPGRPILDPILALPFIAGVIAAVRRRREPAYGFTLMWLAFGLAPTLVVGAFTSTIHSIAAQTPIFVLLAVGVETATRFVLRQRPRWKAILFGALVVYSSVVTAHDYFDVWTNSPAVRAAYYTYFASMIDVVNARPGVRDAALSSAFPNQPLDPFIAARRLRRSDVILRHFDARRALDFPDADSALLLIPALTPLDPALAGLIDLPKPATILLRPDDSVQSISAYDWNPRAAAQQLRSRLEPFNIRYGDALELLGARIVTPKVAPGGEVVVVTLWGVLDPAALGPVDPSKYSREAVLFTHMLGADGAVAAQDDRLDASAASWRAGDMLAQVHRLAVRPGTPPGAFPVRVGVYTLPSLSRLDVHGGDTVLIGSVEVTP